MIPYHAREFLIEAYGARCQYCGFAFPLALLTLDHIVPSSRSGTDALENLTLACRKCNESKGILTWPGLSVQAARAVEVAEVIRLKYPSRKALRAHFMDLQGLFYGRYGPLDLTPWQWARVLKQWAKTLPPGTSNEAVRMDFFGGSPVMPPPSGSS